MYRALASALWPLTIWRRAKLQTPRILFVDDEKLMRHLIPQLLGQGFAEVDTVENGVDALAALTSAEKPYHLLICDLVMPVMSGLDLLKAIRSSSDPVVRDVPVVVLTGHSERENVLAAMRHGVSGFLAKPVSRSSLVDRILLALAPKGESKTPP